MNITVMKSLTGFANHGRGQSAEPGTEDALFYECLELCTPLAGEDPSPGLSDENVIPENETLEHHNHYGGLSMVWRMLNKEEIIPLTVMKQADATLRGSEISADHLKLIPLATQMEMLTENGKAALPPRRFPPDAFSDIIEPVMEAGEPLGDDSIVIKAKTAALKNLLWNSDREAVQSNAHPRAVGLSKWEMPQIGRATMGEEHLDTPSFHAKTNHVAEVGILPEDQQSTYTSPLRESAGGQGTEAFAQGTDALHLQNQSPVHGERFGPITPEKQVADAVQKELKLQWLTHHPEKEIRVRLVPESLGEVTITLQKAGDRVVGIVSASHESTKEFLEQHQSWLKERLPDIELKIVHSESHMHSQTGERHFGQHQSHGKRLKAGRVVWLEDVPRVDGMRHNVLDKHV